jgi:hypothetical protein
MKVQLVDNATRTWIGKAFKVSYRLMKDDEVYYEGDGTKFEDTVWLVVSCRTESYDATRQVVFVVPKSQNATRALRGK